MLLQNRLITGNKSVSIIRALLLLSVITLLFTGCSYFGMSNYEKGTIFLKDKKFSEALHEFQKVDPDNTNFTNAQSKINYINGLLAFNDDRKSEASVFLSKVLTNDEYYHDSQLMLEKINEANIENDLQSQIDELKNKKDTVIIKKEVNGTPRGEKNPVDPVKKEDLEISRKYVSDAGGMITRFESSYQSAKDAPLSSKSDFSRSLEVTYKEFNYLKYTAQHQDAGVLELKKLISAWMNKRIAFIHKLLSDKTATETPASAPLREEGDKLYTAMINQLNKVKKSI